VACAAVAVPTGLDAGTATAAPHIGLPNLQTIRIGAAPDRVAVGAGAVWTGDVGDLFRVDPRTQAVRRIPDSATPVAADAQAVWARAVLDFDTVERIDPTTQAVVAKVALLGSPAAIAVDADAVWVVDSAGVLTRIDPATNQVVATIALGTLGFGVATTPDAVWVSGQDADGTRSRLWRVDPATNTVTAAIDTAAPCSALASAGDDTWAECGTAQRLDLTTNQLLPTDTNALNGLAVSAPAVYTLDTAGNLTALDPQTRQAGHVLDVPELSEGLALGFGSVWIANPALTHATNLRGAGTLLRLRNPGSPA
jgi:DNA-binding beta-propeller fold protein YncE